MTQRRIRFVLALALVSLVTIAGGRANSQAGQPGSEPNSAAALRWWKNMADGWTPVSWKDHLFRFNVMFNGTLVAAPDINTRTRNYADQGVQLMFYPSYGIDPMFKTFTPSGGDCDPRAIYQHWDNGVTPVLCSDWSSDGVQTRQSVFAHIPGGQPTRVGDEPLFAWVRLSINVVSSGLPLPDHYGFAIKINSPYFQTHSGHKPIYPRTLTPSSDEYDPTTGYRLTEPDGKVRLAIAPGQKCHIELKPGYPTASDTMLFVLMDIKKGASVDMLVPMLPTDPTQFNSELSTGYEGALAEANRYWAKEPSTAVHIDVPEAYFNQALQRQLQMAQVTAERNPTTGISAMLTGCWIYSAVWTTCESLAFAWTMDTMGYHSEVDRYLEAFRLAQGTVTPPGGYIKSHPGYLGTPKPFASVDWLCDHGALLWAASEHALLTGDPEFIAKWTPAIIRGCEFIRDARRITAHNGVKGLMPPAAASDFPTVIQSVWNDGWMYKGLSTAVQLLQKIGNPRAAEFAAEARDYKATFVKAFRARMASDPLWTDSAGRTHHFVPKSLFGEAKWETRSFTYLDCGPMMLVFSGLFDAKDPEMRTALLWFRDGPQTKISRYDANPQQVPCLFHEMSSAEPCYSWNVFHSWELGDRERFLEGLYSQFFGALSQETYSMCETRGGVMGLTPAGPGFYMVRIAVADDRIEPGALHLLRFMPLAWLRSDRPATFENLPTYFGPVTLRARLSDGGHTLLLRYSARYRGAPSRVVLHVPPVPGLRKITVNGKPLRWDGKSEHLVMNGG